MKTSILEYLEASALRCRNKVAAADEKKSYTFEELRAAGKKVGSTVAEFADRRSPVPVLMDKGADALAAFMGIVYAGCCYTCLDVKQPILRLNQIIMTLQPTVMIVGRNHLAAAEELKFQGTILCYEELLLKTVNDRLLSIIQEQALDIDPLYVNFTSGSTGVPKGVVVSHRSVIDFIDCFTELFHITEEDVIGNQAPFDFDVSVKDIYAMLKTGATMQIIPKKLFSFPVELLEYLCLHKITTLIWAVSALCIVTTLKGLTHKVPDKVNKILFSGEVMPVRHLNEWRSHLPDILYVNLYGPTEITCNCTYYVVDRDFQPGELLPMGKSFPNEKVFLLDGQDGLITQDMVGRIGELCVSGSALALGYYNNAEQTAKAFVQNPLNCRYDERMYRTGDLARYNEYGELCFASRKDFQIKHMGHRIELGEIEAAMETLHGVERICCIYYEEKHKIIAFYEGSVQKKEILRGLTGKLPGYMLPNVYYQTDRMPLTNNGKINRSELLRQYMEKG